MAAPLFSLVTPVYDTPADVLQETIQSVLDQTFTDWEWLLVDDCSPSAATRAVLEQITDPRIKVQYRSENGGIVAASNDAVDAATAPYLALLDHDDLLTPDALAEMAAALEANPEADYLYSDEDKVDANGRIFGAFIKPDWSPERFRHQMYTCHFSVLSTALVREVGGFRPGYDGSQDHDLVLRVTEKARQIVHLPTILYHWRIIPGSAAGDPEAKPYAWTAGLKAVQDHLDRCDLPATADYGLRPGTYRVTRKPEALPTASLIFPTRGDSGFVWGERRVFIVEAVRSALAKTSLDPEVVVVYDEPTPDSVLEELREIAGDRLVLVPFLEPFNFSLKCNLGFTQSTGEAIVLMNDDLEAISDGWLEELLGPLTEPDVGMTGAKLLFPDGTYQHGGHQYAGSYHHAYYGRLHDPDFDFCGMIINREVAGVTGACAALRREVFEEVGGLCNSLPGNFNDVDLCYKVRHQGYRIVWVANCELYHFESQTRVPTVHQWESAHCLRRWGHPVDPYMPVKV